MIKHLYNTTEEAKTYVGIEVPSEEYLEIPYNLVSKFANTSMLLTDISNGDIIISKSQDVSGHITDVNTAINFLKETLPREVSLKEVLSHQQPFAAKVLPDGKKLFTRVHGISAEVHNSTDTIDFNVPYANCKITGIEIVGCGVGDKINMKIIDTPTGTISGVPNYQLNQFGFDVWLSKDIYRYRSEYDADLIQDLKIRIEYDAKDELLPKIIYINYILHQVVT